MVVEPATRSVFFTSISSEALISVQLGQDVGHAVFGTKHGLYISGMYRS